MRYIKVLSLLSLIIFSILISGCKDNIVSENDLQQPAVQTATFNQIQKQIFNSSCATSGCHEANNPQAGLSLMEGQAYSKLVNVQSTLYPNLKRIVPGNKDASLLYIVLSYNSNTRMPPTGKLSQSVIDSIGAWINRGAPNN